MTAKPTVITTPVVKAAAPTIRRLRRSDGPMFGMQSAVDAIAQVARWRSQVGRDPSVVQARAPPSMDEPTQ